MVLWIRKFDVYKGILHVFYILRFIYYNWEGAVFEFSNLGYWVFHWVSDYVLSISKQVVIFTADASYVFIIFVLIQLYDTNIAKAQ